MLSIKARFLNSFHFVKYCIILNKWFFPSWPADVVWLHAANLLRHKTKNWSEIGNLLVLIIFGLVLAFATFSEYFCPRHCMPSAAMPKGNSLLRTSSTQTGPAIIEGVSPYSLAFLTRELLSMQGKLVNNKHYTYWNKTYLRQ